METIIDSILATVCALSEELGLFFQLLEKILAGFVWGVDWMGTAIDWVGESCFHRLIRSRRAVEKLLCVLLYFVRQWLH